LNSLVPNPAGLVASGLQKFANMPGGLLPLLHEIHVPVVTVIRGAKDIAKCRDKYIRVTRKTMNSFLGKTDSEARKLIDSLSEPKLQTGQVTAGISMFYFEELPQN